MLFTSIKQLNQQDIEELFSYCSFYSKQSSSNYSTLKSKHVATVFFEPSTRTQLSFQKAVYSLGGNLLSISDISQTRSNSIDSEDIRDTLKVISSYSDCTVFRSKRSLLDINLKDCLNENQNFINAGDGRNEHPLQALGDCWLIYQKRKNFDFPFGFIGDCTARVFRSVLFLLTKLGVSEFHFYSTNIEEFPSDILNHDKNIKFVFHDNIETFLKSVDIIEVIPYKIPFDTPIERKNSKEIVLTESLVRKFNSDMTILHPGPRNFELSPTVDKLPNSLFFEQARTSTFMKMAILTHVFSK
ncbi:hypothetical protein MQW34_27665 (plasmid) [Bacillus sp. ZJS3]|uniref:hypothetical protein n=1 Tax=Bacillus sp. ZJS3 TaxID=2928154 RepID=UPI001FB4E548|nr:hypothetical protein [Bacillus sp. ZJS3]UOB81939.1 hypothetical protein MQW34_27665 [Bacillus sp. ZJS3]